MLSRSAKIRAAAFAWLMLAGTCTAAESRWLTPDFPYRFGQYEFGTDGLVYFTAQELDSGGSGPPPYLIFAVPQTGGPIEQLTPTPTDNDLDVGPFHLTPNGQSIVYRQADHPSYGDLYVMPSGGSPTRLTFANNAGGGFADEDFWLTADGTRAVYIAETIFGQKFELFSVALNGGSAPVQLNGPLSSVATVQSVSFAPESADVLYVANQEVSNRRDLFRVAPNGGPTTRINLTPGPRGSQPIQYLLHSADDFVVYRTNGGTTNGGYRLFGRDLAGGVEVPLATDLPAQTNVARFYWSADESHLLYAADPTVAGRMELFSAPVAGGPASLFTGLSANNPDVDESAIAVGRRGGEQIVGFRTSDSDGQSSFYVAPAEGGVATLLGRLGTPSSIIPPFRLQFSLNGDYLFAKNNSSTAPYLYAYSLEDGHRNDFGQVGQFLLHPDGLHIVYSATHSPYGNDLFWERIDRSEPTAPLSNDEFFEDITGFVFDQDAGHVLYKRGPYHDANQDLFIVGLPTAPTLVGDFNENGRVEAADYVVWRNGYGSIYTMDDYNDWKTHFGEGLGSEGASSVAANVPEPSSSLLAVTGVASVLVRRRKR